MKHVHLQDLLPCRCWAVSLRIWCLCISQLTVELISERVQQVGEDVLHADVPEQLNTQGRHTFILNPTRHNVSEPGQVCVAVQGQAVRRDVATTVDSWKNSFIVNKCAFRPAPTAISVLF